MESQPTGPLFAWPPPSHGLTWLEILPLLAAAPAIVLLVRGLVRGRLPQPAGVAGVVFFPIAAYAFAGLLLMENSKQVQFCGSCHVMTPILESLSHDNGSLASIHYIRGRVSHDEACFVCHSGYGIWGTVGAKLAGVRHMFHTVTGHYDRPLKLNGPFDIDSCLNCHKDLKERLATQTAHAPATGDCLQCHAPHASGQAKLAVEAHQAPDLQEALVSRQMSCTGVCHPAGHPDDAIAAGAPAS